MLKIDLYSDPICPRCIIGAHRLDKVLRERFPDLEVDIEHIPFELHPDAPPEGFRIDAGAGPAGRLHHKITGVRPNQVSVVSCSTTNRATSARATLPPLMRARLVTALTLP